MPAHTTEQEALDICQRVAEEGFAVTVMREGNNPDASWVLKYIGETPTSPAQPGLEFIVEKIPGDIDWLTESYRSFPPFEVGPFFIRGSHCEKGPPEEKIELVIDAATAFGSGEHGTTKGCLLALLDLKDSGACPWNILDMGTGSGILAIAAWKLWKSPTLAIDNDPEAVRVAARHCRMNRVPEAAGSVVCETGEGFQAPSVASKKPFDLIIANILAGTLKEMAPSIAAASDENGHAILSGILKEQAEEVLKTYLDHGFVLRGVFDAGEWTTLTLRRRA